MSLLTHLKAFFTRKTPTALTHQEERNSNLVQQMRQLEESSHALSRCILKSREVRWRLQAQRVWIVSAIIEHRQGHKPDRLPAQHAWHRQTFGSIKEVESGLIEIDTNLVGLQYQESKLLNWLLRLDNKLKLYHYLEGTLMAGPDPVEVSWPTHQSLQNVATELVDVRTIIQRAEERIREMQSQADAMDALVGEEMLIDALGEDHRAVRAISRPVMRLSINRS